MSSPSSRTSVWFSPPAGSSSSSSCGCDDQGTGQLDPFLDRERQTAGQQASAYWRMPTTSSACSARSTAWRSALRAPPQSQRRGSVPGGDSRVIADQDVVEHAHAANSATF